jgi:hypothetical protein
MYVWKSPEVIEKPQPMPARTTITLPPLESIALGATLHKTWQNLQTGTPTTKKSDKQFLEKKMAERYQIFQKRSGEREAARRIDYR